MNAADRLMFFLGGVTAILRKRGYRVHLDYTTRGRGLKSQLREANKMGARWVLIMRPENLPGGE